MRDIDQDCNYQNQPKSWQGRKMRIFSFDMKTNMNKKNLQDN